MSLSDFKHDVLSWMAAQWQQPVMIPVFGRMGSKILDCWLVPETQAEREMASADRLDGAWAPGFCKTGGEVSYSRYSRMDGAEPLVLRRDYDGMYPETVELAEEFRLMFQLYHRQESREYLDLDGNVVARMEEGVVRVHRAYLKRYLAAKGMALVLWMNDQAFFPQEGMPQGSDHLEERGTDICLDIGIGSYGGRDFQRTSVKQLLHGGSRESCGLWPYEKTREYLDFIIGLDADGREVRCSCDPALLQSFGSDPDPAVPHYLTMVAFRREVLQKYYASDRYEVQDGLVACGGRWSLRVDNDRKDGYVAAYLGDLGRDLPDVAEQRYWQSYNVAADAAMSPTRYRRDFLVQFAAPETEDLQFKRRYREICRLSQEQLGWPFFLPLAEEDAHNFTALHVPEEDSDKAFDDMVMSLAKLLVDSLNEKAIGERMEACGIQKPKGSVNALQALFDSCGCTDAETPIKFLRELQELRSSCAAHRKGKTYKKLSAALDLSRANKPKVFRSLLGRGSAFLAYVQDHLEALPS